MSQPGEIQGTFRSKYAGTLVQIADYDSQKHLVDVTRLDGTPLEGSRTVEKEVEQKKVYEIENRRVLKIDDDSNGSVLEVTNNYARLSGNKENGFFSYKEDGNNIIKGPLSIAAMPGQVRLGGITTLNPLLISCFPSTIVSPMPTCIFNIPGVQAVKYLQKAVGTMATLVAVCGG
jgi:hypothetical protein